MVPDVPQHDRRIPGDPDPVPQHIVRLQLPVGGVGGELAFPFHLAEGGVGISADHPQRLVGAEGGGLDEGVFRVGACPHARPGEPVHAAAVLRHLVGDSSGSLGLGEIACEGIHGRGVHVAHRHPLVSHGEGHLFGAHRRMGGRHLRHAGDDSVEDPPDLRVRHHAGEVGGDPGEVAGGPEHRRHPAGAEPVHHNREVERRGGDEIAHHGGRAEERAEHQRRVEPQVAGEQPGGRLVLRHVVLEHGLEEGLLVPQPLVEVPQIGEAVEDLALPLRRLGESHRPPGPLERLLLLDDLADLVAHRTDGSIQAPGVMLGSGRQLAEHLVLGRREVVEQPARGHERAAGGVELVGRRPQEHIAVAADRTVPLHHTTHGVLDFVHQQLAHCPPGLLAIDRPRHD